MSKPQECFILDMEELADLKAKLYKSTNIAVQMENENNRLHNKCKRQRLELRRLNKVLKAMYQGARFAKTVQERTV